ncbi:MAG: alpha/beta hydrolase [Deltaproteobacteria bacterium]
MSHERRYFMKSAKILIVFVFMMLIAASGARAVEIGPNPTSTLLNGDGTFAVSSASVSSWVTGFGGGTIYYPSTAGSYGVIAVCPGFTGTSSSISWFARRLATHGFVTIAMNTNSIYDQPSSRATQLRAALNYMINSASSTVRSRIDSSRRGVAGHSMGGGGTLIASNQDSTLKVGVPMTPWNTSTNFSTVRVPQMIFGADGDTIAPYSSHARPFYNSIPTSTKKAYALLNGATHFTPNSTDQRIGRYGVAFAKRFVDGDTRYTPFLCGSEHTSYATSSRFDTYLSNCPY